jgi:hypothetical protein
MPGSELGGEPSPAGRTVTTVPQWNVPDSEGGVKVDMICSTSALAAFGLVVDVGVAVSAWEGWSNGGLSA